MGDFDSSFSLSSIICEEDKACLIQETQDENTYNLKCNYDPCLVLGNEDEEYIEKLFERETGFGPKSCGFSVDCPARTEIWLKCARLDAIEWIFNTRAMLGFQFRTAYLSVDYFDRFLSKRFIDDGKLWAIRLLSVACLSLAAKMEECKVPALSEYQVEDFDFENKVIQRMELLILSTLEWKMGSITPFDFLHYFIGKFCRECRPNELVSRAVELIMTIGKEINLMNYRPSIIAAAAVLAVSDGQLTRETIELKMNVVSSLGSLEIERIYFCYNLMHEIEMGKLKTPKSVVSQVSSTNSIDVLENSVFASGAGTKRRHTYNYYACPSKKLCPP